MEGSDCFIWIGWIRWVKAVKVKYLYLSSSFQQLTLSIWFFRCLQDSPTDIRKGLDRPHIAHLDLGLTGWLGREEWAVRSLVRTSCPYHSPYLCPILFLLLLISLSPSWTYLHKITTSEHFWSLIELFWTSSRACPIIVQALSSLQFNTPPQAWL